MNKILPKNDENSSSSFPQEQLVQSTKTNSQNKFLIISVVLIVLLTLSYISVKYLALSNKKDNQILLQPKSESVPSLRDNQETNLLVFYIDDKTKNNIVNKGEAFYYNLDTKEKTPFKPDTLNESNLPIEVNNAVFSSSPKEDEILFLSDSNDFITVSTYNQKSKQVIETFRMPKSQVLGMTDWRDFSFSPDKTKLVYATFGMGTPGNIFLINLSTKQSKQITSSGGDTSPKWLNNDKIIFERRDELGDSLWTVDVSSGTTEMLLGAKEGVESNTVYRYVFTNDRNKIIFPSNLNDQGQDISVLDIYSKQITKVFHIPYYDFTNAQISEDDRYLVWGSLVNGKYGSRSIFSYDFIKNEQNTICESFLPNINNTCGDFYLDK